MLLAGKTIVVTGVLNRHSLAHTIALQLTHYGARVVLLTQVPLQEDVGVFDHFVCDLTDDDQIASVVEQLTAKYPHIEGVIHSVANAPFDAFTDTFTNATTRSNFHQTIDASAFSLLALVQAFKPYLTEGASIVTLTYDGGQKFVPGYNVMGVAKSCLESIVRYAAGDVGAKNIRVNAVSTGPYLTNATKRSPIIKHSIEKYKTNSLFKREISREEIANTIVFLCSNLSTGITGETIFVDGGFNIINGVGIN